MFLEENNLPETTPFTKRPFCPNQLLCCVPPAPSFILESSRDQFFPGQRAIWRLDDDTLCFWRKTTSLKPPPSPNVLSVQTNSCAVFPLPQVSYSKAPVISFSLANEPFGG